MTPKQMESARKMVADVVGRTSKADLFTDPDFKARMTNTLQRIMLDPDYPREFIAATAAVAMMMLVEQIGVVES